MSWLEVSLRLRAELVDPAAELLGRIAPNGVAIEPIEDPAQTILVRAWLPADGQLAGRRRALQEGLWHLGQIQPFPNPTFETIEEQNWDEIWRREYQPLPVGRRLMVVPSWSQADPGERLTVRLEPGMAFGTGAHPTTRHCLELLEENLRPGQAVVDLGCGSGILAIAAAKLGARHVWALDVDPLAVELATFNVERNAVAAQVEVALGSFPNPGSSPIEPVELVLANLRSDALIEMLHGGLASWVRAAGQLVLSGLLDTDLAELIEVGEQTGLRPVEVRATDDWRTVRFRRQ